jgi:hypothetical protein
MHKFFTSSYDASIYLQQPEQNAGRDEILEVGKLYYGSAMDIARTLIKFNTTHISQSIVENIGTGSYSVFLNLKSANSEELPLEYTLYANAISGSWKMGTGTKFDNITSDGVSWYYINGSSKWQDLSGSYPAQTDTSSILNGGGGLWYSASMASQSFSNEPDDIRMDVTNIVKLWISGSNRLNNDGIILHHHTSASAYTDTMDYGILKFFSKETNTIYEPKLELVWDDTIGNFNPGSLSPITGSATEDALENSKIIVTDLQKQYSKNIKTKIRVKARDLFPSKSFTGSFEYDQSKYLPTSSYYQIEDYRTNEIIIPFGEYSKLSCDSKSNYFYLDTSTYPIDRVYKLKLKVVKDGITKIIDDKLTFEII